jgi:hypothetical protein
VGSGVSENETPMPDCPKGIVFKIDSLVFLEPMV